MGDRFYLQQLHCSGHLSRAPINNKKEDKRKMAWDDDKKAAVTILQHMKNKIQLQKILWRL